MDFDQQNTPVETVSPVTMPQNQPRRPKRAFAIIILIVIVISYAVGYQTGHKGYVFVPKEFKIVNQDSLPKNVDYSLLWNAINILNTKYIDKPVDPQKILQGAISGAVAAAGDPYTVYFDPTSLNNFQTGLKGSFDGIGAEVGIDSGNIVVVAPLADSPAQKAGIKAKDIITKVNGQSTAGWSVDQAVTAIRGPKGTSVTVTVVRAGVNKPIDYKIIRDEIQIKSVTWTYKDTTVNGQTKHLAVITIAQFGDDTTGLFSQAVNDVLKHSVDGIILDLRNNPGGYLQSAVDVASNWISLGTTVVTEAHSDGTSQKYTAEGNNRLTGIKTVILMNGGTASAAEILSGALHDYHIAELIGEKSFGKGSVQELVPLDDSTGTQQGAVKVTVAKWITPNGINLNHNGLDPDVPVTITQDQADKGQDPQMDKAVEEVTK